MTKGTFLKPLPNYACLYSKIYKSMFIINEIYVYIHPQEGTKYKEMPVQWKGDDKDCT